MVHRHISVRARSFSAVKLQRGRCGSKNRNKGDTTGANPGKGGTDTCTEWHHT